MAAIELVKMAFGKRESGQSTHRSVAPPPHWMKQIEEKYQRLHAKIHNQSMRFMNRRHAGTLTRKTTTDDCLKDMGSARSAATVNKPTSHAVHANSARPPGVARLSLTDDPIGTTACEDWACDGTGTNVSSTCDVGGLEEDVCYSDNGNDTGKYLAGCGEQQSLYGTVRNTPVPTLTVSSSHLDLSAPVCQESSDAKSSSDDLTLDLDRGNHNRFSHFDNDCETIVNSIPNDIKHAETDEAGDSMEVSRARRRRRDPRAVKTPSSRISHKTSQSCPAALFVYGGGHDIFDYNQRHNNAHGLFGDGESLHTSAQPRIFARMSEEARHAVNELMAEDEMQNSITGEHYMTSSLPIQRTALNESSPTGNVNNNNHNKQYTVIKEESSIQDGDTSVNNFSQNNLAALATNRSESPVGKNTTNKGLPLTPSVLPGGETRQRQDLNGVKRNSRKLPQLDHAVTSREDFPKHHQLLPDIGRPREPISFRENTFEITPVDFDIRFHQIIPYNTGDSPPPDIRQQAIEKCQHWLIRQTPRH
ncbi:hypothetical protein Btru_027513 [Bulinus truncatus]|nr:hypothetical protein Btru_027513 [Bulinus truncatus]